MTDLTIFVGTFNRLDTLRRCVENLERQNYPKKIVIVDNGSTWDKAVGYLNALETKYTVYRMPGAKDAPEQPYDAGQHGGHGMMTVQRNYSEAFRLECETGESRWFAVCDCDTAPDGPIDSLAMYVYLAQVTGCAVGPHLNLNTHRNYPLRSAALIMNARVLFRDRMEWQHCVPYSFDDIDSSFHLFPAAPSFDRLKMRTIRVGPPWWTTHTDWEIDVCNPTAENHAYILSSGDAASWGGNWIRNFYRAWISSPEEAFALMDAQERHFSDYDYSGFILSWMLQYGHGCEVDLVRSEAVLYDSFPEWSPCWTYEQHWEALLDEDLSCLGWT